METLEEAYQSLNDYALSFAEERTWDLVVCKFSFLENMVSGTHWLLNNANIDEQGGFQKKPNAVWVGMDGTNFIKQDILERTGELIWGLTFTLYPDGKFNIEYDYNKPDIDMVEEPPTVDIPPVEAVDIQTNAEARHFFQTCRKELELKTSIAEQAWGLDRVTSWEIDQMFGMVTFKVDDDLVFREVEIVGTYNTSDQTFMWAWDNPSVDEDLQEVAGMVREYGETYGIASFTTHHLKCSEDDAWNFAAVACHLAEAEGAYRGEFENGWVYFVFREEQDEE